MTSINALRPGEVRVNRVTYVSDSTHRSTSSKTDSEKPYDFLKSDISLKTRKDEIRQKKIKKEVNLEM